MAFLLAGSGCAMRTIKVSGYAEPQARYQLTQGAMLSVEPNHKAENPILARQIQNKLKMALNDSGWRVVSGQAVPLSLSFTFGTDKGTENRSRAITEPGRPVTVKTRDEKGNVTYTEVETPSQTRYVQEQVTVYEQWLKIKVTDSANNQAVWIGEASHGSSNDDPRTVMDYLIAALVKTFGQDTQRQIRVTIKDDDPVLQSIRMAAP